LSIQDLVDIGRIIGPHGINGIVKIHPLTDFPKRFEAMDMLDVYESEGHFYAHFKVLEMKYIPAKGYFFARLGEINSRNEAESLRGFLVKVPAGQRVQLPEDEYWIDDIIGLEVVDMEQGTVLGNISGVFPSGDTDIYQVLTKNGETRFIPAVSEFIRLIDIERGLIQVVLPEGLWE